MSAQRMSVAVRGRDIVFGAGTAVLLAALVPPVEAVAEELFVAHMAQHLALFVAAPLLLAVGGRARAPHWLGRFAARRRGSVLVLAAVTAGATLTLWCWHWPAAYDAALEQPVIHVVEHASYVMAGLAFWGVVLHTARRHAGLAIGAIFVSALMMGALAALLVFIPDARYAHGAGPGEWGLTALEDQQLGGAVMWGPGGALYVLAGVLLFARWLQAEERRTQWMTEWPRWTTEEEAMPS